MRSAVAHTAREIRAIVSIIKTIDLGPDRSSPSRSILCLKLRRCRLKLHLIRTCWSSQKLLVEIWTTATQSRAQMAMKRPRPRSQCRHRGRWEHRGYVIVEAAHFPPTLLLAGPWTIARSKTPNVFTIAFKASRIANRVLLLNVGSAAAVLKIIDCNVPHVLVLNASKIDPHV